MSAREPPGGCRTCVPVRRNHPDAEPAARLPHLPLVESVRRLPRSVKPTWRGWIHAGTFPLVIVLGTILVVRAEDAAGKISCAVFVVSSLILFGMSALYHRINWSPPVKRVLQRVDHANIFLLIAGTYTPIAVLCLTPQKATILLSIVWGGALAGIGIRMLWTTAPRWLFVPLYLLLGYGALMDILDFFRANAAMMSLIIIGGVLYSVGAGVYALKRPNPVPGVFEFHEVFHALTLLAFLCHWTAIFLVAVHPPTL